MFAKGVMNNLPGKAAGPSISESQLRGFIDDGKDIAVEFKQQLAAYLHTGPVLFDAEHDLLVRPEVVAAGSAPVPPAPWINPNPKVAAAQKAYHDALREARGA